MPLQTTSFNEHTGLRLHKDYHTASKFLKYQADPRPLSNILASLPASGREFAPLGRMLASSYVVVKLSILFMNIVMIRGSFYFEPVARIKSSWAPVVILVPIPYLNAMYRTG